MATLAATAAAFALGRQGARQKAQKQMRALRAELAAIEQLQSRWTWRTDAAHGLLCWQAPGLAPTRQCRLFEAGVAHQPLADLLQARHAFSELRLTLPSPQEGSAGWVLSGTPRQDDEGRFDGFVGVASPTDATDALHTASQAVPLLLGASSSPSVVAVDGGQGWQVLHFNAAAQALWPSLAPGVDLADTLRTEATAVLVACKSLQPGEVVDLPGRRLAGFGLMPGGARGLVLTLPAVTETAPKGDTAESDSFSFTVSHDLRAPIRVVEGFTRIVKEDYGRLLDRVGNDHLDRVLGAAARMNLMIDALLTLARLSTQPLARQPVNLSQLAGYVVDELRRSAPEREADVDIEPGLSTVGDPTLLRLVLENLLGNAWKYSARCARAQVSLRTVPHGPGHAYVVRDNGAGFDMRSSDRLFGLFQRLHSASEFPGHGVGLASVRRIVRRHGGDIWAEAEPGRGAAFFFTLGG
jgi:signal transduction histidine kinase